MMPIPLNSGRETVKRMSCISPRGGGLNGRVSLKVLFVHSEIFKTRASFSLGPFVSQRTCM